MRRKNSTGYLRFFFLRVVDVRRPAEDVLRDGAAGAVVAPSTAGIGAPWPLPSAEVAVAVRRRGDAAVRPSATAAASILSLIHISEPTRLGMISYAVFCL